MKRHVADMDECGRQELVIRSAKGVDGDSYDRPKNRECVDEAAYETAREPSGNDAPAASSNSDLILRHASGWLGRERVSRVSWSEYSVRASIDRR